MQHQTTRPTIPFPIIDLSSDNPIPEILNAPKFGATETAIYKTAASQRALISAAATALIYTLVRNAKPQHVVEIGTYYGGTSEADLPGAARERLGHASYREPVRSRTRGTYFRFLATGAAPAPGILSHDFDGLLLPAECARHQAGDRLHRWRPFLSSGAFRYPVAGEVACPTRLPAGRQCIATGTVLRGDGFPATQSGLDAMQGPRSRMGRSEQGLRPRADKRSGNRLRDFTGAARL